MSANGGQAVRYTSRFLVAAAGALSVPTPNKVRHAYILDSLSLSLKV